MTDLNHPAVEAETDWPALDTQGRNAAVGQDQVVARAVESIQDIPDLPVADHPERFAATHDALLAALNDDALAIPGTATDSPPRPGGR